MLLLVTSLAKSVLLMPFMSRDEKVATFRLGLSKRSKQVTAEWSEIPGITHR